MSRIKLTYNKKDGRVELWNRGFKSSPIACLSPEEFSDLLGQINDFVESNTPALRKKKSRMELALRMAMRKDAWKWIGGAIREKLLGKK